MKEKALHFNGEIEVDEQYIAGVGWLECWKNYYGVRKQQIRGEKLSANQEGVDNFKTFLHRLVDEHGILGDQLYNCEQTGLNSKTLWLQNKKIVHLARIKKE